MTSPVSPLDIDWAPPAAKQDTTCPVCGHGTELAPLLETRHLSAQTPVRVFRCSACASLFADPPEVSGFDELLHAGVDMYRSYVEVVGGIWEMYWPVGTIAVDAASPSLLDVGCGFGFTVDLWRSRRGAALGVEVSGYGRSGSEILGVPIRFDYLENMPDIAPASFDIVYASEVIEHVPDPVAFARLLGAYVAPGGVLALTTPNAAYVSPENDLTAVMAALAPGYHGFLLNAASLSRVLVEAGFAHVAVSEFGSRLIAHASSKPLVRRETGLARAEYLAYLEERAGSLPPGTPTANGILYRLVRDLGHAGRWQDVLPWMERLDRDLEAAFGGGTTRPESCLAQLPEWDDMAGFVGRYPYFMPMYLYLKGNVQRIVFGQTGAAADCYEAAFRLAEAMIGRLGFAYCMEACSLLWAFRLFHAGCRLQLGQAGPAAALIALLGREKDGGPIPELGFKRLTDQEVVTVFEELGSAAATRGDASTQTDLAGSTYRYLQSRQQEAAPAGFFECALAVFVAEWLARSDPGSQAPVRLWSGALDALRHIGSGEGDKAAVAALRQRAEGGLRRIAVPPVAVSSAVVPGMGSVWKLY